MRQGADPARHYHWRGRLDAYLIRLNRPGIRVHEVVLASALVFSLVVVAVVVFFLLLMVIFG